MTKDITDNIVKVQAGGFTNGLRCPICSSASSYIFTSKHGRLIYQCPNGECGHFFTPPKEDNQGVCDRNENGKILSDRPTQIWNERNQRLLGLFVKLLKTKAFPITFLDFGAGSGHISQTFKQVLGDKVRIYCLEPNPVCKELYKEHGLHHLPTLGALNDPIDLVYIIEVIEHLEDPIYSMSQLKKILRKDGKIFISTPVGKAQEHTTNAYDTPSHLHFFTDKSLNLTLKKAGLTEINYKFYPELYPLSAPHAYGKLKASIKRILKNWILMKISSKHIGHLVGISELKN